MEDEYMIKVTRDGPYLVQGGPPLAEQIICLDEEGRPHGWKKGRGYEVGETYSLCRCGRSEQQPFCDGSHAAVGFDGTETAADTPYLDQAAEFLGPELILTDAESYCAGAGFCRRAGGTWRLTRNSQDPVAKQTAVEQAFECPSGRLVVWEKTGRPLEPELERSLGIVIEGEAVRIGPLWVRGGIPIQSAEGRIYEVRNRVTLCRCGRSANKPFCDGTHQH